MPLRAIVVDPSDHGGVYREDALISVGTDGVVTWWQIDSSRRHEIGPDRVASVRVQQAESSWGYPHDDDEAHGYRIRYARNRRDWRLGGLPPGSD